MNSLNKITDTLIEIEFKGLTPFECLLKILKENKKAEQEMTINVVKDEE